MFQSSSQQHLIPPTTQTDNHQSHQTRQQANPRSRQHQSPIHVTPVSPFRQRSVRREQEERDVLARWLLITNLDRSGVRLSEMLHSQQYAALWYAARDAGERARMIALEWLYAHQQQPGGRHPDPRLPAPFSARSIIATVARYTFFTSIWQTPLDETDQFELSNPDEETTPIFAHIRNLAWIITYPNGRAPDIMVRPTRDTAQQNFEIACCLGYIARERQRLTDMDAPAGAIYLPRDPALISVLHQFTVALLALPADCPPHWTCPCNHLRRVFNAPPASHLVSTDVLEREMLKNAVDAQFSREREPQSEYQSGSGDQARADVGLERSADTHPLDSNPHRTRPL